MLGFLIKDTHENKSIRYCLNLSVLIDDYCMCNIEWKISIFLVSVSVIGYTLSTFVAVCGRPDEKGKTIVLSDPDKIRTNLAGAIAFGLSIGLVYMNKTDFWFNALSLMGCIAIGIGVSLFTVSHGNDNKKFSS